MDVSELCIGKIPVDSIGLREERLNPATQPWHIRRMRRAAFLALTAMALGFCGCATHSHVSRSKQQQVDLVTQTGIYSYQRAMSPPR
jgi:hypothetical protein